jgi:hypothetical protein
MKNIFQKNIQFETKKIISNNEINNNNKKKEIFVNFENDKINKIQNF